MNKDLPCYIVLDLLPLYQDNMLSEETIRDIDMHISECNECKQIMDNMKVQIDIQSVNKEISSNPLRKINFYQKTQTILGAIVAFFLGLCLPIAKLIIPLVGKGEIPDYYFLRLKVAWHIGLLKMGICGVLVCTIYLATILILKKLISKK